MDELYLLTPEYLTPYLNYIRNNRRLFLTATKNAAILGLDNAYEQMFHYIFTPILERYGVPAEDRAYRMTFYVHGLMAIITQWLECDCEEPVEYMIALMQKCVAPHHGGQ